MGKIDVRVMINRSHRFHGYNALTHVYKGAKTNRNPHMALKYLLTNRNGYRLAVVVSRKVHKSAVKRNRIRRRLYEAVRLLNVEAPVDLIITVFDDSVSTVPSPEVEKAVRSLFASTGLIKQDKN